MPVQGIRFVGRDSSPARLRYQFSSLLLHRPLVTSLDNIQCLTGPVILQEVNAYNQEMRM
jgi:hypothetical protein